LKKWKGLYTKYKHKLILVGLCLLFIGAIGAILLNAHLVRVKAIEQQINHYKKFHESTYFSVFSISDKIHSIYNQLLSDNNISEWTEYSSNHYVLEMYTLRLIQNTFYSLVNSHSEITSFYLYNKNNDLVLSTNHSLADIGKFRDRIVFDNYYDSGQSYIWTPARKTIEFNNSPTILSFTAGLPYNGKHGALSINIDAEELQQRIFKDRFSLWIDRTAEMIIDNEEMYDIYMSSKNSVEFDGYWVVNNNHIFVTTHPKEAWKVITIIPHDDFMVGIDHNRNYTYAVIIIALLLSVLVFWYIRHVFYLPNKKYQINLEENLQDLQQNFISNLLTSNTQIKDFEQKSNQFGLDLVGSYQIVVFQIDDYYNYLLNINREKRFFMNKVIFNSIKWTFKVNFNAYPIETSLEKIAILLCLNPDEDKHSHLEDTIRYLQNDIRDNCGLTICVGISQKFSQLEHAPIAYSHAQRSVEYKAIYGKLSIIYYEDIRSKQDTYDHFPIERINEFSNLLKKVDIDAVERCLDDILDELVHKDSFNLQIVNAVFANMMSEIIKTIMESRFTVRELFEEDLFITLYSYDTIEDKRAYLVSVCQKTVDFTQNKNEYTRNKTSQLILEYIHQNYDKPISLTMLADELGMNSSYLSAFIKNNLGTGFVEYVSELRIEKSVKLLMNGKLSIQQIAEDCGYETVHSFIRNFKKKFRVPPNEYRTTYINKEV
jgi:AraC-like DNA-binding protein